MTSFLLSKPYPRLWSLDAGVAMVVTDLHGDWDAYQRYRNRFVDLQARGQADCLILTGDLIHRDEPAEPDRSLDMVLDVLKLRATYGDAIIYLCGNHELPHIYGFGLSKGDADFTPAFEAALGSHRSAVIKLFRSLPFFVRTAAGISLTHAGASEPSANEASAFTLFTWSHEKQLAQAEALLADQDVDSLRRAFAKLSQAQSYDALARYYLAVTGADDPRYNDLLRGFLASTSTDFGHLYEALFTSCERENGLAQYSAILTGTLQQLSIGYAQQRVLVAGHMVTNNGHTVIADRHLRLASGCHAGPRERGAYLLFDAARPIKQATDLLTDLRGADHP
jgi:Icc-related predicted phosphoesterase